MKSIALRLGVLGCLLAVVCADPGKVVINGECKDCYGPDGRPLTPDGYPVGNGPMDHVPVDHQHPFNQQTKKSGAATQTLASGAVTFGLFYYLIYFLQRI
ncbi:hypothetical protein ACLKA7_013183 [Drosophila subpalustris]